MERKDMKTKAEVHYFAPTRNPKITKQFYVLER